MDANEILIDIYHISDNRYRQFTNHLLSVNFQFESQSFRRFSSSHTSDNAPALTHVDESGRARMVDVSFKQPSDRIASAQCHVRMSTTLIDLLKHNRSLPKGDALSVAELAGVMGAKQTSTLIPLCHPLCLNQIVVRLVVDTDRVIITATVRAFDRTGVEMEALMACSIAALTLYDMCKAVSTDMIIENLRVIEKTGGKRDVFI